MPVWRRSDNWTYEYYPIDEPAGHFGAAARLVDIWRSKQKPENPAWSDFDLMDFKGYWGWLVVHDAVPEDPLSFDVRLFGANVADICQYDLTGQRLHSHGRPVVSDYVSITANDLAYYRFILDKNVIGHAYGPYKQDFGDLQTFSVTHLPLSRTGEKNDQLILLASIVD